MNELITLNSSQQKMNVVNIYDRLLLFKQFLQYNAYNQKHPKYKLLINKQGNPLKTKQTVI